MVAALAAAAGSFVDGGEVGAMAVAMAAEANLLALLGRITLEQMATIGEAMLQPPSPSGGGGSGGNILWPSTRLARELEQAVAAVAVLA